MSGTLIIGYGNPLRGDDAVGYEAAVRLGGLAVQQLTPELTDAISQAAQVIFIDAGSTGEPGTIERRTLAPAAGERAAFTHYATPEALLAGAHHLFGRCPPAVLITIAGSDFGLGQPLSEPVRQALEHLVTLSSRYW